MTVKKIMGICLAAALLLTALALLPISARAATTSGTCGGNLTWNFDENGTLTISGNGEMPQYTMDIGAPWIMHKDNIRSLVVEEGVTSIGNWAFQEYTALQSVTLGSSVLRIGDYAFVKCENLVLLNLPDGLTYVGEGAFKACTALSTIEFPNSVSSIGPGALQGCVRLKHVTLSAGLTGISDYLFFECRALEKIVIPEGVREIGTGAFIRCVELEDVTLPDSLRNIGESAFANCSGLATIRLPNGLATIGSRAFQACRLLKSITIPEGVIAIGTDAFAGCERLRTVTLPSSLEDVYWGAFDECPKLWHVFYEGTEKQWNTIAFFDGNDALLNAVRHPPGTEDALFDTIGKKCQVCCQLGIHGFDSERAEPTCTADGYVKNVCRTCGESTIEVIPAIDHDYRVHLITSPTFTTDGFTDFICDDCGISYRGQIVPSQGKVMMDALQPTFTVLMQYVGPRIILMGVVFLIAGIYKLWQRKRKKR